MNTKFITLLLAGLITTLTRVVGHAQDGPQTPEEAVKLVKGLKYQQGEISLRGGLARLTVPTDFKYLGPEDAETVLVKLWGNPPSGEKPLGLLMPANVTPLSSNCWVVTIEYMEDGYVKDKDAGKINYDDLLKQMQKGTVESNKKRSEKGYPTVELLGWAATPRYDATTHKLYWAKRLKFEGEAGETLNYDIRMLGRGGVLVLSAVSSLDQLAEIEKETPQILGMVDFKEGHRYADFDPKADKVATYGIAALVAGGIAAKMGFFKLIWVFVLAAKKFIIIALVAIAAWFRKIFSKRTGPGAAV
jgi:uncharacterized membrane-anchored protein